MKQVTVIFLVSLTGICCFSFLSPSKTVKNTIQPSAAVTLDTPPSWQLPKERAWVDWSEIELEKKKETAGYWIELRQKQQDEVLLAEKERWLEQEGTFSDKIHRALSKKSRWIFEHFRYVDHDDNKIQSVACTDRRGSGVCRDFSYYLMEWAFKEYGVGLEYLTYYVNPNDEFGHARVVFDGIAYDPTWGIEEALSNMQNYQLKPYSQVSCKSSFIP